MDSTFIWPRNRPTSISVRATRPCGMLSLIHLTPSLSESVHVKIGRKVSARCPAELPPNIKESQLEVLGLVGTGAFGRVLKVRHRELGLLLVLKEVLTECKDDEAALVREISLLCNLKHPNILNCIGVVMRNKRICLLTEYISRGCLHNLLLDPPQRPLSWPTRVSYAKDIAAGMDYLHQNNLIHRDLTTMNCLVRQDDSVVVSDFGLSKFVNRSGQSTSSSQDERQPITAVKNRRKNGSIATVADNRRHGIRPRRHTVVGSPFWMAPEMLSNEPYNNAVDIYSFGIILCQLLARCDADPDHIPRDSIRLSVDIDQFLKNDQIPTDRPDMLVELAQRCVAPDPDARPSFLSCVDWLDDCLLYLATGRTVPNRLTLTSESAEETS